MSQFAPNAQFPLNEELSDEPSVKLPLQEVPCPLQLTLTSSGLARLVATKRRMMADEGIRGISVSLEGSGLSDCPVAVRQALYPAKPSPTFF